MINDKEIKAGKNIILYLLAVPRFAIVKEYNIQHILKYIERKRDKELKLKVFFIKYLKNSITRYEKIKNNIRFSKDIINA